MILNHAYKTAAEVAVLPAGEIEGEILAYRMQLQDARATMHDLILERDGWAKSYEKSEEISEERKETIAALKAVGSVMAQDTLDRTRLLGLLALTLQEEGGEARLVRIIDDEPGTDMLRSEMEEAKERREEELNRNTCYSADCPWKVCDGCEGEAALDTATREYFERKNNR
jgi:hypothetical protein